MSITAIRPEWILRDLQRQWEDLAQVEAKAGGVLRACAMTLVVATRTEEESLEARRVAGMLMRVHPSRAIIIHPGGAELDARVFAECWKPLGKAQQICSEGIDIIAGAGGLAEVARFLVPLRVPDLPVVLWCRGSAVTENGGYNHLYSLADKIIFDTQEASDADAAMRSLRRLHAYGLRVADLHWTRLTGWREVIAHLFDHCLKPAEVRSARVTYGGGSATSCALYLRDWIHTCLPLARVSVEPDYGPEGLYSVTFSTPRGDLSITRSQQHALAVAGHGLRYETALPSVDEAALMQEELSILASDTVYERVLTT